MMKKTIAILLSLVNLTEQKKRINCKILVEEKAWISKRFCFQIRV